MLSNFLISITIISTIAGAPKLSTPINFNNIGVVEVKKLGTDAVPQRMNIQGYIDSSGVAINDTIGIEFSIWTDSSAGSRVWGIVTQTCSLENGLFNTKLDIQDTVFRSGNRRWLQLKVSRAQDPFPRIEITSVGFAFRSVKSDTASYAYSAPVFRPIDPPIVTNEISDSAVTNPKLADNSISTSKIQNGSITTSKILNGNVTDPKIATGITDTKISGSGILIPNLNADMLDGCHLESIPTQPHNHWGEEWSGSLIGLTLSSNSGDENDGAIVTYGNCCGVYGEATSRNYERVGGYFVAQREGPNAYGRVGCVWNNNIYRLYGYGNCVGTYDTKFGTRIAYSLETPEPLLEDIGTGQLSEGFAHVKLDPIFLDCIHINDQHPLKVFVQLNDNCNGVYVKPNQTGFDVYELMNGKSTASFTYRVLANRRNTEFLRFPHDYRSEK